MHRVFCYVSGGWLRVVVVVRRARSKQVGLQGGYLCGRSRRSLSGISEKASQNPKSSARQSCRIDIRKLG